MSRIEAIFDTPAELVLGRRINQRVPVSDQERQRLEVEEILKRLRSHPGLILADEVGMGKTFVALGVAYSVAVKKKTGPVVVMVPANLVDKWVQDLKTFSVLYLENREVLRSEGGTSRELRRSNVIRYGVARQSIELMKLLDDDPRDRCHFIFLAQGAMSRSQSDKWIRLAIIAEALRRHARGNGVRLIRVKNQIHRFLGELLWAIGEQKAQDGGADLWVKLLKTSPLTWKDTYNSLVRNERHKLRDDPVPKAVVRAIDKTSLKEVANVLEMMPLRDGEGRSNRISNARRSLAAVEKEVWTRVLFRAHWRSPLLVLDEAHHLKNPGTALARQLQSRESENDLRLGEGAMANAFDRMLFLTATPFQLGHHELINVLRSFNGVKWNVNELGNQDVFQARLDELGRQLTESQRTAINLQRQWKRLRPEDFSGDEDVTKWWTRLQKLPHESLTFHQAAVLAAFESAQESRHLTEKLLRPWIVRHNKETKWAKTEVFRRKRFDGASIQDETFSGGLKVPGHQLLPFFLAARSAASPSKDVLGEALCSSFEAFRYTRNGRELAVDEIEELERQDVTHGKWYLNEFDVALSGVSGAFHPKISATVKQTVDLWEKGEKVLVFAFYRHTCRALRIHISNEIERRMILRAQRMLSEAGQSSGPADVEALLTRVQDAFFDEATSVRRKAVDQALGVLLEQHHEALDSVGVTEAQRVAAVDTMRRFLREQTALIRCFPLVDWEQLNADDAVNRMLDHVDGLAGSWRQRFNDFIRFISVQSAESERQPCLDAVLKTDTGRIPVSDEGEGDSSRGVSTLANVREATGRTKRETRNRLMRAFNMPFFPDVFVCSEVMSEGVDLQRYCRNVIHHDLAWNPSNIEQRTGRIDRIGCRAEGKESIQVYVPYIAGTADERQYKVMSDRERWFRVVMGQDAVAKLITPDSECVVQLPEVVSTALSFKLGLD